MADDGQRLLLSLRHAMTDTVFCYHCRAQHPINEVRRIKTRSGQRWRCLKSIAATRNGRHEREAFGRQTTEFNKAMAESRKLKPLPPCLNERHAPRHALDTLTEL